MVIIKPGEDGCDNVLALSWRQTTTGCHCDFSGKKQCSNKDPGLLFLFRSNQRDISSAHSLSSYQTHTGVTAASRISITDCTLGQMHPVKLLFDDMIEFCQSICVLVAHTHLHTHPEKTEAVKRNPPGELISSTDVNVKLKIRLRSESASLCVVTTKPFILSQHGCVMVCGIVSAPAWVQSSPSEGRWWLSPHAKSCRSLQSIGLWSEMLWAGWNVTVSHEDSDRLICCVWLTVNILFKWKPQRKY